jgi:hypothetical protein
MPRVAKGCVEQLPSGSWRARVYAGVDPITKREIRLKATAKTEQQAHIELGRLLKDASEGRTPESAATMAKLLDEYALIAPWDVSTRQTNEGFIRRSPRSVGTGARTVRSRYSATAVARRSPVTAARPSGAHADSLSAGRTCWRMTAITRSVMTARNTGADT